MKYLKAFGITLAYLAFNFILGAWTWNGYRTLTELQSYQGWSALIGGVFGIVFLVAPTALLYRIFLLIVEEEL